jgi:HK97 family phage major capsid protein
MDENNTHKKVDAVKAFVDFLNEASNPYISKTEAIRKEKLIRSVEATKGNIIASLDVLLLTDEDLRNEWNYEAKKQNKSQVAYPILSRGLYEAKKIDQETYKRAGGILDTTTNPGGQNFLQTTVTDYVAETVEELGIVAKAVTKHDMANSGILKIPVYNAYLKSTWAANNANYTDLGQSVEGNISSVSLNTEKVGAFLKVNPDYLNSLSANRLQWLLKIFAEAQARAYDDAILNGTGINQLPLGMNQNAQVVGTDFAAGADAFETVLNAATAVAHQRKGQHKDIKIIMNTAGVNHFKKLAYSMSNNRAGLIEINNDSIRVGGYETIITDVIENTGTIGSQTTQITVGIPKMYHWGESKKITIATSDDVAFLSGQSTIRVEGSTDGVPTFNNAFAKFTIPSGT